MVRASLHMWMDGLTVMDIVVMITVVVVDVVIVGDVWVSPKRPARR